MRQLTSKYFPKPTRILICAIPFLCVSQAQLVVRLPVLFSLFSIKDIYIDKGKRAWKRLAKQKPFVVEFKI